MGRDLSRATEPGEHEAENPLRRCCSLVFARWRHACRGVYRRNCTARGLEINCILKQPQINAAGNPDVGAYFPSIVARSPMYSSRMGRLWKRALACSHQLRIAVAEMRLFKHIETPPDCTVLRSNENYLASYLARFGSSSPNHSYQLTHH